MAKQLCSLCYYISSCNKTAKIRPHINITDPLKPFMQTAVDAKQSILTF